MQKKRIKKKKRISDPFFQKLTMKTKQKKSVFRVCLLSRPGKIEANLAANPVSVSKFCVIRQTKMKIRGRMNSILIHCVQFCSLCPFL